MIKAVIFDLDGTLVQTEVLKAQSYAKAIHELTHNTVEVDTVLEAFHKYVGLSRMGVVNGLTNDFKAQLQPYFNTDEFESLQDWVLSKRLTNYQKMIADKNLISDYFCPFNLGLFHQLYKDGYTLVLATMSHLNEACKILDIMGITDKLSFILTRDMVSEGKPKPEIYLKAQEQLKVTAEECLVIEDSVNGIKAALNAHMHVFAVTNDITRTSVHNAKLLSDLFIIDSLEELRPKVYQFLGKSLVETN